MANGEIKTKLVLEGEAEYKRQMTDAANAVKVLDSEQKLAAAQFRQTGDAQKYAADSADILKRKIEEQQRAVNAAQAAVTQLTEKGVDPNSRAMQTWQTKLNNAKTKLTDLQTKLGETEGDLKDQGDAFDNTTVDAGEYNEQLAKIEREVRFQNVIAAIDSMANTLGKALTKLKDFGIALYNGETEAGKWADNIATAATQAGIDPETYQSWLYASQFIDTEVDAIIKAREKLTQKLVSENDESAKAFNRLGVATRDADGSVRDATDVFWDCVDSLGRIDDDTERASAAEDIFGKSWRELQPVIEAGSTAYKSLAEEGKKVAVVSQENVDKLGALDDSHNKLNSAIEKTKLSLQAELAPAFTKLNDAAANALAKFNEWAESPAGQEALQKLGDAAVALVDSITGKDFENVINLAADAVTQLTGALDWIKEHGQLVTDVIIGMAAAWAGLKVTKEVLQFAHLLSNINWDKIGSVSGGSSAVNAAQSAVGSAKAAAQGSSLMGEGSLLNKAARVGLMGAAVFGADQIWEKSLGQRSVLKDIGYNLGVYDYQAHSESGQEMYNAIKQAVTDGMDAAEFTKQRYGSEKIGEAYQQTVDTMARWDARGQRYNQEQQLEVLYRSLEKYAEDAKAAGKAAGDNYATTMQTGITEGTAGIEQAAQAAGENASVGLANGINARADEAIAAAEALANQVASTMQSALDIHSPSKVMEKLGEYVGLGFAQGIDSQMGAVERAMDGMISATQRTPARPMAAHPMQAAGPRRVVLQIDKTQLCEVLVDDMDTALGAVVRNRR